MKHQPSGSLVPVDGQIARVYQKGRDHFERQYAWCPLHNLTYSRKARDFYDRSVLSSCPLCVRDRKPRKMDKFERVLDGNGYLRWRLRKRERPQ